MVIGGFCIHILKGNTVFLLWGSKATKKSGVPRKIIPNLMRLFDEAI